MANLHLYIVFFFLSSVKFLLAPAPAVAALGYWEAIIITSLGGWAGVCFFYFSASYFFRKAHEKRVRKEMEAKAKGTWTPPKKFTRFNRNIIKIKHRFGLIGFCIITPAIISIPIGCILMARFYPNWKITIPLLFIFVVAWSFFLSTFGAYVFKAVGWM